MPQRPASVGGGFEPDGDGPRRTEVARSRQLLSAEDVLVGDAGQVDRRPHSAVNFADGRIVTVQRPHADPLPARKPVELVADSQRPGSDGASYDRPVTLKHERTV